MSEFAPFFSGSIHYIHPFEAALPGLEFEGYSFFDLGRPVEISRVLVSQVSPLRIAFFTEGAGTFLEYSREDGFVHLVLTCRHVVVASEQASLLFGKTLVLEKRSFVIVLLHEVVCDILLLISVVGA